ncbi:MAG: ATP-binding cassette domain-containing protein [Lachnospiraceae bacterium]|nr:ATP-binding cassette domain-containing protein [Lachnospiraceae bacterium]
MIKISNLCKKYGEHVIFEDFSCEIKDGEFVVFNGVSGKGKTTLLNMIGGLEKYNSGSIEIDGLDLKKSKNVMKLYKDKIGFLFQNFALVEKDTVDKNLKMIDKKYRSDISIQDALKKVGLENYEKRKIYTLSGGEQQRVAIARLLLKKCSVVLADEPTGSLDRANADIIMNYLKELNEAGKTIIMVTHDEKYKSECGRVIEL